MISYAVEEDVQIEIRRAIAKHGPARTPLSVTMADSEKLVILVEEVGEVARAITYDEADPRALYNELIQVAAMAMTWAECARMEA